MINFEGLSERLNRYNLYFSRVKNYLFVYIDNSLLEQTLGLVYTEKPII